MPSEVKSPIPPSAVDVRGRLIPESAEARAARSARILAALDWIEAQPATPEDEATWRDVLRGIDEGRPQRKLFEGMY